MTCSPPASGKTPQLKSSGCLFCSFERSVRIFELGIATYGAQGESLELAKGFEPCPGRRSRPRNSWSDRHRMNGPAGKILISGETFACFGNLTGAALQWSRRARLRDLRKANFARCNAVGCHEYCLARSPVRPTTKPTGRRFMS